MQMAYIKLIRHYQIRKYPGAVVKFLFAMPLISKVIKKSSEIATNALLPHSKSIYHHVLSFLSEHEPRDKKLPSFTLLYVAAFKL